MILYDHIFLILFTVVYPAYVFFSYHKIKHQLVENKPGLRKSDYQLTSFWLWLMGLSNIILWIFSDRSFELLGFAFDSYWPISIGILFSCLIIIYFFSLIKKIRGSEQERLSFRNKLNDTDAVEFLPKNIVEFKWFVLLSISAGVCEEMLFRGYLFWYFEMFDNIAITIVISSLLFGLAHSYQGWSGIIRTALMGLFMAIIYAVAGLLWIPIFLHILVDIYGGIIALLAYEEVNV